MEVGRKDSSGDETTNPKQMNRKAITDGSKATTENAEEMGVYGGVRSLFIKRGEQ